MQERLIYLYERWLAKTASESERQEFMALLEKHDPDVLAPSMKEAWQKTKEEHGLFTAEQKLNLANTVLAKSTVPADTSTPVRSIHRHPRRWLRYAAAVALLLGAAFVYYLVVDKQAAQEPQTLSGNNPSNIQPGGDRAVLTLADGTEIILDSANNGTLANQGNARVVKLANGQIAYDLTGKSRSEMLNTMRTPKGGLYQLTLPDGSRVWLNAASSITFPVAFIGKERKVKITGEAYFEVARDQSKPFLVDIDGESLVEVLGTSFNINAYKDEEGIRSTLVSGSIKVSTENRKEETAILKPGQTFVDGSIASIEISRVLAWKNGILDFNGRSFQSIMKDVERWYDIEVHFTGSIPGFKLKGEMDRGVQLNNLMEFLQQYGLQTKLEGRKLIITEKK
ncbi:FecR family protein [Pseudoflavitalea rhizosphaerae]|uniref:FecR family protein n=1 Tax=Pseudoflavitalea rhizosphaerae TaxID=1884793 RepID=UPI000F8F5191|nr:FecR family protein [Pseudoflavitalea rhizosphaerae]